MSPIDKCRGCDADIVFLRTPKGHFEPVEPSSLTPGDWEALQGATYGGGPTFDLDRHRSHFARCPNASEFRERSRKTKAQLAEAATPSLFDEVA